jgi:hypothetical protein
MCQILFWIHAGKLVQAIKFILETTWNQARNETFKVHVLFNYCGNFNYINFGQFNNNLKKLYIIVNEISKITSITDNIKNSNWNMCTSFTLFWY